MLRVLRITAISSEKHFDIEFGRVPIQLHLE